MRFSRKNHVKAASGLAAGATACPELAEKAVEQALVRLGTDRAATLILLLSNEFDADIATTLRRAARVAGTLQISGLKAHGVFTEQGWEIDRPAVAVIAFGENTNPAPSHQYAHQVKFLTQRAFPEEGRLLFPQSGIQMNTGSAWHSGRLAQQAEIELQTRKPASILLSRGLRMLTPSCLVTQTEGLMLTSIDGQVAGDFIRRFLPPEAKPPGEFHRLRLIHDNHDPGIGIVAELPGGALLLTHALAPGMAIQLAIRQPLAAGQEMRSQLSQAKQHSTPDFALMFSTLARGPMFYGGEDDDLRAVREIYPDLPMAGAYGDAVIFSHNDRTRMDQNSVLTLLYN